MSTRDIIRAWKDAEGRATLGAEGLALLPAHPAGLIEAADVGLDSLIRKGLRVRSSLRVGWDQRTVACETLGCPAGE